MNWEIGTEIHRHTDTDTHTHTHTHMRKNLGYQGGSVVKNLSANVGYTRGVGLIPGSRRSSGEGNGNSLHFLAWNIPGTEEPYGL